MKKKLQKVLTRGVAFLLVMTVFQSCFIGKMVQKPKMQKEFTVENDAIPPDFGKEKTTILVMLRERGSYDRYLKSAVKKNYTGDYVFVTSADMKSGKYSDTQKYRYMFDYTDGMSVTTHYSNGDLPPTSATSVYKRFYVEDLSKGKRYQSGAEFSFFALAMKVYFQNLEIKRNS